MKILLPEFLDWSTAETERFKNFFTRWIGIVAKHWDISGLTCICFVDGLGASGEMVPNSYETPLDFTIKLSNPDFGLTRGLSLCGFLQRIDQSSDLQNTLLHELAHVHDYNKRPQVCAIPHKNKANMLQSETALTEEEVMRGLAVRVWSEFFATKKSANIGDRIERIDLKIKNLVTTINDINDPNTQPQARNKLVANDFIIGIAYLIGEAVSKGELANARKLDLYALG